MQLVLRFKILLWHFQFFSYAKSFFTFSYENPRGITDSQSLPKFLLSHNDNLSLFCIYLDTLLFAFSN